MNAPPRIQIPRPGDSPVWRLILIVVLLIFVATAHLLGMAIEVTVLMITTVASVTLQLTKPASQPFKAL